jgi:Zn-dependent oligopeptidases
LQFADDRQLREEMYSKNARRASELAEEGPDHDNSLLMAEILHLRQQQAKALGVCIGCRAFTDLKDGPVT